MKSDTFCILPWIHMYVNPDGSVLPCCIGEWNQHLGNVRKNTIEEIWNDLPYQEMRDNMLKGKRCTECKACYQQEDAGSTSTRQERNAQYAHLIPTADSILPPMNLKHFDVRWSNICNFKCRSCSSTYSSTWAQEDSANGNLKDIFIMADGDDNSKLYDQFLPHFINMESFYFAGGEPLLTDKHYDILEHLISLGKTDVRIEYNTNLSNLRYKNKSVVELWKHFSNIQIFASLDHYGDRAEFIREGTDWNKIVSNIKTIKQETPHVQLNFSSVLSVFNLPTITDFLDYLFDKQLFDSDICPSFYNIMHPDHYSANILTENEKLSIVNKIKSRAPRYNVHIQELLKDTVRHLENSKFNLSSREEFVVTTDYYDKIRDRDFAKTFPELKGIVE